MQKGFAPIIILIGVLIIGGLAFGSYFYLNKNKLPQSSQNLQSNQNNQSPTSLPKAIPNNVNKIAYLRPNEVWVVNEDGTEPKKVLSREPVVFNTSSLTSEQNKSATKFFNEHFFSDLSWSRDGKKLAVKGLSKFIENQAKDSELAKKNGVGGQFWYPPQGDIYLIDVDTGQYQVLEATEENTLVGEIQWSYDNKQIVFTRERPFNQRPGEIVMVNTDPKNRNEKVLTTYPYQGNNTRGLIWLPERGEVIFQDQVSYHVSSPEPALVKFNYMSNKKDNKPFETTKGYRTHTHSLLNDDRIMYFNTALGPDYGTEYGTYEIRVANIDGSNSKVVYTGKDCGKEEYQGQGGCYWMYFAPNGMYSMGGKGNSEYILNPELPKDPVLDFHSQLGSFTWSKDGNKIAYLQNGNVVIYDLTNKTQKTITQQSNITEIKWAF